MRITYAQGREEHMNVFVEMVNWIIESLEVVAETYERDFKAKITREQAMLSAHLAVEMFLEETDTVLNDLTLEFSMDRFVWQGHEEGDPCQDGDICYMLFLDVRKDKEVCFSLGELLGNIATQHCIESDAFKNN